MKVTEIEQLKKIPAAGDNNEIMKMVREKISKTHSYFVLLKSLSGEDDTAISDWLNINEKTFRSHKSSSKNAKPIVFEHAIMLLSLYKHGIEVFGNKEGFNEWLGKGNFYFDNLSPREYMNTASGIKYIEDRLTAMEYGDNA